MAMNPRLLRPILSGDPDALRYIAAVQAADQQSLEPEVRKAINDFVVGCKQDGIWDKIKASCILMGARTLAGINVPLAGPTPTFNAFDGTTDYNRKTGLRGNGSSKYINTNRAGNADGQNDVHAAVYQSEAAVITAGAMTHIGCFAPNTRITQIAETTALKIIRARDAGSAVTKTETNNANGLQALSRSTSASFVYRAGGTDTTVTVASLDQDAANFFVLAQNSNGTTENYSNARLAFYSIGSALTLSLLDSRISTLYTAIGAAPI